MGRGAYDLAPPLDGYLGMRPHPRDGSCQLVQLATGLVAGILGTDLADATFAYRPPL